MSTLPVPASVNRAESASLVLRRPRQAGPPANIRGRGPDSRGSEGSLFVIDGPSVPETVGAPVVLIAVKVVSEIDGDADWYARTGGSALSRVLSLPVMGDPYAEFGAPDRGKLVDKYV